MTDDISEERKKLIYRARLSEHCERYEDMVEDMKSVALNFSPMDVEERNLMSVGYKNVVGQRRTALRTFKYLADHQPSSQIDEYITRVEEELDKRCNEILCQVSFCVFGAPTPYYHGPPLDIKSKPDFCPLNTWENYGKKDFCMVELKRKKRSKKCFDCIHFVL